MYESGKAALLSNDEQKLNGNSNEVKSVSAVGNSLYVASGSGSDMGVVSKINLKNDSRIDEIDTASTFSGSTIGTLDTITALSVGDAGVYFADNDEVFVDYAEVKLLGNFVSANEGEWMKNGTASWYKEAGQMPAELKLIAMDTGLSLLDSSDNSLWMHFAKGPGNAISTAVQAVTAVDGSIYAGTENGVIKIDFANDQIVKIVGQSKYTTLHVSDVFGERNSGEFFYSDEEALRQGDLVGMWEMESLSDGKITDASGN